MTMLNSKKVRVIFTFEEAISLLNVGVSGFIFRNAQGKNIKVTRDSDNNIVVSDEDLSA